MMSKKAEIVAVVVLLIAVAAGAFFLRAFLNAVPIGGEQVEAFDGGPNMKEASEERTADEDLLYQQVSKNPKVIKNYFLDVTGDGENELLSFEETVIGQRNAHRITIWGTDQENEVRSLVSWTVYNGKDYRTAIYLHPEYDGSYTIIEDNSFVEGHRKEGRVSYRQFRFTFCEGGFKREIVEQADGPIAESQGEYAILDELLKECLLVYDTLPGLRITNIDEAKEEIQQGESTISLARIYDVIPQGWEYVSEATRMEVETARENTFSGNEVLEKKAEEQLIEMEEVVFQMHTLRIGPFRGVGDSSDNTVPYAKQIKKIEESIGLEIEYVVLDSWEELEKRLDQDKGDGITKLVLFNNTYTGSLIHEMQSDRYADLGKTLEDFDFYNEEKYEQNVLYAGMTDGRQVLVPLLYNVSGMVQGEAMKWGDDGKILYDPNPIEAEELDYIAFIEKLISQMETEDKGQTVDYISAALDDKIAPELFLSAAGIDWNDYENQEELFNVLVKFYEVYQNTQIAENGLSKQYIWGYYWGAAEYIDQINKKAAIPDEMIIDLNLSHMEEALTEENKAVYSKLGTYLMDSCTYIVESSTAEDIAYHSMVGLLDMANYYLYGRAKVPKSGEMAYHPIGIMKDEEVYAAQPVSYVAVLAEDGHLAQAAEIIEAMLAQETDVSYGFSLNNEVREKQLENWEESVTNYKVGTRHLVKTGNPAKYKEMQLGSHWSSVISGTDFSWKAPYAEQLRNQLDNVGFAQIPDREVLLIWQETIAETVKTGISAEAGFEMLCERMDAFYE